MRRRVIHYTLGLLLLLVALVSAQGWRGSIDNQEIFYGSAASPQITNTATLGTSTAQWLSLYTRNLFVNGVATAPAVLCSNIAASTAITTTAAKTYFNLNCAVPAALLTAGKTLKVEGRGVFSTAVTDTVVLTLDLCTVSGCGSGTVVNLATTAAVTPGAVTNQGWLLDENIATYTIGAAGTVDVQGFAGFQTAALLVTLDPTPNTAVATVSTIVQEFLSVAVTFSTASATDTITLRNFKVVIQ